MLSLFHDFVGELAENWLAFLYIVMTCFFSICFLRERRQEARALKKIGLALQKQIDDRCDRLEKLVAEVVFSQDRAEYRESEFDRAKRRSVDLRSKV